MRNEIGERIGQVLTSWKNKLGLAELWKEEEFKQELREFISRAGKDKASPLRDQAATDAQLLEDIKPDDMGNPY